MDWKYQYIDVTVFLKAVYYRLILSNFVHLHPNPDYFCSRQLTCVLALSTVIISYASLLFTFLVSIYRLCSLETSGRGCRYLASRFIAVWNESVNHECEYCKCVVRVSDIKDRVPTYQPLGTTISTTTTLLASKQNTKIMIKYKIL